MSALYYRGPSEPGGDDDIIAEVVDGKLRRGIEISNEVALCTGFDDHPVAVDISGPRPHIGDPAYDLFRGRYGE